HELARWKRADAAALFPTGFAANLGVLSTFGGPVEIGGKSAAEQLAAFTDRDRNTDVVVELVPGPARFPDSTGAATPRTAKVRVPTPWVVRGRVQLATTVDGP
ncbi:MAG: hypothetical protein K6W08_10670, partial [Firmicutes bacterium]|nr:hypothetical protein [Bacillota bacterium]